MLGDFLLPTEKLGRNDGYFLTDATIFVEMAKEKSPTTLGPQNHEKWRFYTPKIWVITYNP